MARKPSFTRADRLEQLMLDEVERLIEFELRSPLARRAKPVVAKLSPDLGHLRVGYVLHGGGEPPREVQEALTKAAPYVARALGEVLDLKKRLEVAFTIERDALQAQRVQSLLQETPKPTAEESE
jgi:ribosome-binding factor A